MDGTHRQEQVHLPKMKKGLLKWWLGMSLLVVLTGCGKPISKTDLPGTYVADYEFATETVTIKKDGQFIQSIQVKADGKIATTNGTWHFNQGDQDIVFSENFMQVMDGFGKMIPNFDHPKRKAISILPVRRSFGKLQIGVDPAIPYKKQATP